MALVLYPAVIAVYEELFKQATLNSSFKLSIKQRERLMLCKFVAWMEKKYLPYQITETLVIQYFEFQFSRYSGIVTPRGKNNIMLNWVIGEKAIQAWEQRKPGKNYIVKWQIKKEFSLQLRKAFTPVKVTIAPYLVQINHYEESEKERFYNTPKGYVYCGQMTTLYNPKSSLCQDCEFSGECRERLQNSFPQVFKLRVK